MKGYFDSDLEQSMAELCGGTKAQPPDKKNEIEKEETGILENTSCP